SPGTGHRPVGSTPANPVYLTVYTSASHAARLRPGERAALTQRGDHAVGDLVDLAHPVDDGQQASPGVDVEHRLGLLPIHLESTSDHVLGVIGTPVDLGAA